ncbi:cell wall-active antibiotics response protein LiaF [Vaginisenegalia massiliensis]|uniref:cell wall-active antibiotics response protein LiaF n=1 Tax=Vaginisenegalia massiliensis TaxID=2058294 RepID=UPI000F525E78|nr:cell wall-active antibiotics response protein LiaF [Vaginisenegalia massiliensis]
MKAYLKRNIFLILLVCILVTVLEVVSSWGILIFFALGVAMLMGGLVNNESKPGRFLKLVGLFMIILSLLMTDSIWMVVICFILIYSIFDAPDGNEFFFTGESLLHPFAKQAYHGIQLIEPQVGQKTLLKKQSLFEEETNTQAYPWDDINLVYFGGDSIIDLGNTILPNGESLIMVRKVFGRTRLIIPKEVGLKLNISVMAGQVKFENQDYSLSGENFRWQSPDYQEANRSMRLMVSVVWGDVEVIFV